MKKILSIISIITLLFTACDKWPENGYLDGMWQLMEIETDGIKQDTKDQGLFCSFQLKVFMLGSRATESRAFFGYFEHNDSTMRFHHFTFRSNYTEESNVDKLMTEDDLPIIAPWGFYSIDSSFKVVDLTSNKLILKHKDTILTYRKF